VWDVIDEKIFYDFKKQNKLKYDKKTETWNKQFSPVIESFTIDRGHKTYSENYVSGYVLGQWVGNKCKFCGKFLENNRARFCKTQHRTLYHKILKIGKDKHRFEFGKNNHWLLIPSLYEQKIDKEGKWTETRNNIPRIERKNIKFVINSKRIPLTTKGGKPRSKKKN
jgi:hypothetical protein